MLCLQALSYCSLLFSFLSLLFVEIFCLLSSGLPHPYSQLNSHRHCRICILSFCLPYIADVTSWEQPTSFPWWMRCDIWNSQYFSRMISAMELLTVLSILGIANGNDKLPFSARKIVYLSADHVLDLISSFISIPYCTLTRWIWLAYLHSPGFGLHSFGLNSFSMGALQASVISTDQSSSTSASASGPVRSHLS